MGAGRREWENKRGKVERERDKEALGVERERQSICLHLLARVRQSSGSSFLAYVLSPLLSRWVEIVAYWRVLAC
jgi:hypothetical protein